MSIFIDVPLDPRIPGWPCYSSPRFRTKITSTSGGETNRDRRWLHPLRTFTLPEVVREYPILDWLQSFWLVVGGPEATFPFRDPNDFASISLDCANEVPAWSGADQFLMDGDGLTRTAQLTKVYDVEGHTYGRPIVLPVDGQLEILVDGVAPEDVPGLDGGPYTWTVTRPGGIVEFTPALTNGRVATWGGLFDVEVRFGSDDAFDAIVQSYGVSGAADITLKEERRC